MAAARSPLRRFFLHSLWVVVPFCGLAGLSWNAWRTDAETRRGRMLESASRGALRVLDKGRSQLGPWSLVAGSRRLSGPPQPSDDPAAREVRKRYAAGDYEAVLGSAETVRSEAGLPLRALAALQLLRHETDPGRLGELAAVLAGALDFVSPLFLEEAKGRFAALKLPLPSALAGWRDRWQRAQVEAELSGQLVSGVPAKWRELDGKTYLVETDAEAGKWPVSALAEVETTMARELAGEARGLPDGLGISIRVGEKTVAGPSGKVAFFNSTVRG